MSEAKTLQVRIPADLFQLGLKREDIQRRLIEGLVISLFSDGHISSGKAARLLNISRLRFLELLKERGVAYFDYSPEELTEEFQAVEALDAERCRN